MVILDVKGVFDMTEYKSIQELLNTLCSCIAVDDSGQSYIRTKAGTGGSVNPTPDPDPTPDPEPETFDANIPFYIENATDTITDILIADYDSSGTGVRSRLNCKISYDNNNWQTFEMPRNEDGETITLNKKGDRVYIKADYNTAKGELDNAHVEISVVDGSTIYAGGNIASLSHGTDDRFKLEETYKYLPVNSHNLYYSLFYNCMQLAKAPILPAINLANGCYANMFQGSIGLTKAPDLPAVDSRPGCYDTMFQGCTNLTQAPDLKCDTLSASCFANMFNGCSKLNQLKCYATTIPSSATNCTANWLKGVAASGTLYYYDTDITLEKDSVNGIPAGWKVVSLG